LVKLGICQWFRKWFTVYRYFKLTDTQQDILKYLGFSDDEILFRDIVDKFYQKGRGIAIVAMQNPDQKVQEVGILMAVMTYSGNEYLDFKTIERKVTNKNILNSIDVIIGYRKVMPDKKLSRIPLSIK